MAKTLFIQCSSVGLSTENYFNLFYTIGGSSTLIPAVNDLNVAVSPLSAGQLIAGVTISTPDNVDQIVVNSPVGPCKDTYSYALAPGVSPSLTPSATQTPSVTPTATPTPTVTKTVSITPSISITASITPTPTVTPTISTTASPSISPTISTTASVSNTPTPTPTISTTASISATPSVTPTISTTATLSPTPTISTTATLSVTPTPTISTTATLSPTPTISTTATLSVTPSISTTATLSVTPSISTTATLSPTPTISTTASISVTPSISTTATLSPTPTISTTATLSPTPTISTTASISVTPTISTTASISPTPTISTTATLSPTPSISTTATLSVTPSISTTATLSVTPTISTTASISATPSVTPTISTTASPSISPSISTTASISTTPTVTPTISTTASPSISPSISTTASISATPSVTPTISTTASPSISPSISTTASVSATPTPTPTVSTTATLSITPSISTTASVSRTPSVTPSNSALGFQFATFTAGGAGSAPTAYTDSTTACRQSDTLTGQNLYQLPADGGTPLVTAQLYTNVSCTTAWAPSIPGNRWFKLGRSSVYWAVEVNTSGVVQTVTACTAIPSNTPSATITPTPTVTTPATIFSRSSTDYANEYFACLGTVSGIDFLYQTPGAGGGTTPAVSAQMYTNPGLTTTWTPGGSGWYLFSYGATTYAVLPNASGVLQTVYTCSTLPSQTPTPTLTPSVTPTPTSPGVAFGKSTTTYATTNLACSGTITGTIYQPPAYGTTPTVSVQLYTNSNLTTTWTPPSTSGYYLFQYGGSTKWAVGVGSSGIISSVVDCSAVPSLTPTPTPTPTISTTASVSRTPSTTPSNSQAASGFGAVGGYGNFTDACRGGAPTISIYTAPGTTVPIATTVFYNSVTLAPGTEFNGNNNWFKLVKGANTYAAQISTSGVVTDYRDCSTIPSNTPSATMTPTPTSTPAAAGGYDFYYADDYSCAEPCSLSAVDQFVAFPAGSSVTNNKWYSWSGLTDSFKITGTAYDPGFAVPLLDPVNGPFNNCTIACSVS